MRSPSPALGLPIVDPDLESRIRLRLLEIEKELAGAVASDIDFVNEAAHHLLEAGGSASGRCCACWRRSSATGTRRASSPPHSLSS
ncbi:MAG: hypothetical protein WKF76_04925 [Nocardioidaceae bacterium]